MIRRQYEKTRFWLEQLIVSGLRFRLLIAASIVVVVAVVAGVLIVLLDDGFAGIGDAVWWAFLRLTDPGYLGDDEGVARRTISTVVTVLGYVLFLGLLIAILTQWLNQFIARLQSGVTPVMLSDHVVVLGLTHQTIPIVRTLLMTGGRLDRFLVGHGARELRIVIMAERVDASLIDELRDGLGPVWSSHRVFLRAGTPLRVDHLARVAFRDAAVVVLPGAGFAERDPERVDAMTIKTLASISRYAADVRREPPLVVAELFDVRRVDLANAAYQGASEIVAADGMVGRLIAQSVQHAGLWDVMNELFTLNDGNALYIRRLDGQAGTSFGDLAGRFSQAILLGYIRSGEPRPMLNPPAQTSLRHEDQLVFLARKFDDCVPGPVTGGHAPGVTALPSATSEVRKPRRVLILGWSRKVPALVRELVRSEQRSLEIDIVSRTAVEMREAAMLPGRASETKVALRQIESGFNVPGVLEGLECEGYDDIIVLASEVLEEKEHADAITAVAVLTLRSLLREKHPRPHVFVELLDQENVPLFRRGEEDVMVSPMVVSYIVSQVALRPELARVFWELTRPWGAQIMMRPVDRYFNSTATLRFREAEQAAAAHGEIALGFRRPAPGADIGVVLNPDRHTGWTTQPGDELVVLTTLNSPEEDVAT